MDFSGIDLSYRPESYFWPLSLSTHLLGRVKGTARRAVLQRLIREDRLSSATDFFTRSTLSQSQRQAMGAMHPCFMGGEYLPDQTESEVEIARITIASTTQDVTSVFARRTKHRIYYRVVDEYEGETLAGRSRRSSTRPLTLGDLEIFITAAWSLLDVLELNFGHATCDLERLQRFVIGIESRFYPTLDLLYRRRIAAWAASRAER